MDMKKQINKCLFRTWIIEKTQNIRTKQKSWASLVVHNNVEFKSINQYNKNKNQAPKMLEFKIKIKIVHIFCNKLKVVIYFIQQ